MATRRPEEITRTALWNFSQAPRGLQDGPSGRQEAAKMSQRGQEAPRWPQAGQKRPHGPRGR
eukprot:7512961-Pyramimonas_sp.AAC.1